MKSELGTVARSWGFRTTRGFKEVAPLRLKGLLLQRHVDEGAKELLARPSARVFRGEQNQLRLGDRVQLMDRVHLIFEGPQGVIEIGDGTFLNSRCEVRARQHVRIGAGCMLAFDVIVMDTDHHQIAGGPSATRPTIVGDDVWIGARALVLKGVTIGDGAVVAAGSVVNRDVPPRTLVAGVPARVIRTDVSWIR